MRTAYEKKHVIGGIVAGARGGGLDSLYQLDHWGFHFLRDGIKVLPRFLHVRFRQLERQCLEVPIRTLPAPQSNVSTRIASRTKSWKEYLSCEPRLAPFLDSDCSSNTKTTSFLLRCRTLLAALHTIVEPSSASTPAKTETCLSLGRATTRHGI